MSATVELFPVGEPGDGPDGDGLVGVAATDDGAVWFTFSETGKVGRRAPDGALTFLELGPDARPVGVRAATEDTVWVVDRGDRLLHLGPGVRVVGQLAVPTPGALPLDVVTLPDGTTWFTEQFGEALGRIDILGRVEEYPVGSERAPSGIAASGDSVWFSLQGHSPALGHVRGGDAAIEFVELPLGSGPLGVTVAEDGAVWTALHAADALARVARDCTVTLLPLEEGAAPYTVASTPDGAVWASLWGVDALLRIAPDGAELRIPLPEGSAPRGLTVTPDGTLWAALTSGTLARIHP
ncbi:hypothetical protein ACFRFH_09315 [Leifsonia sp. NPDC056824]|uniref:Vgb family protein n=1 Tax=Leifsonia sp. NPDC056824 TaxID=3345953 RepID=UPI0036BDD930